MPLTRRVIFKTAIEKQNRIQISKIIRWEYKLEHTQLLKVTVSVVGWVAVREGFLAHMRKDGRITIPILIAALLKQNEASLERRAVEVMLEPM